MTQVRAVVPHIRGDGVRQFNERMNVKPLDMSGVEVTIGSFVSGLIPQFDRRLKVGDFVELASGLRGSVREAARRLKLPFAVAYGTDKELVKKAALEAAAAVPFTLAKDGPRAPLVWLAGFGDSSLDFQLVVWLDAEATRRTGSVTAAYDWALHTALEKYGIEMPFPQRDPHVRSWARRPAPVPAATTDRRAASDVVYKGNDAARDVTEHMKPSAATAPRSPEPDLGVTR
nr:mechanosensitive ion channel domain-containing protein [Dyella lutea]